MNLYYEAAIWVGMALLAALVSIRIAVVASFALPFFGAFAFCLFVLGWQLHSAEIGGIALSTTSVAVVYAVMVESGLNRKNVGKLILAACFITDLGTVLALGGLFAAWGWLLAMFALVTALTLFVLPRLTSFVVVALWTPGDFFLRAGTLISASALLSGAGVITALLTVKLAAKFIGVWPAASVFGLPNRERKRLGASCSLVPPARCESDLRSG